MADLPSRLGKLRPTIESLMSIGGTPGLSLAVMKSGVSVFQFDFGFRDAEGGIPGDEETIFLCAR
jgi:CubicO group peptidase (beta-lactamase class C family)